MSTKELAISVWNEQTLQIKFLTVKERFESKSEEEVLSKEICLPGVEKPINIGFMFDFHQLVVGLKMT